jgi:hypothetical protein
MSDHADLLVYLRSHSARSARLDTITSIVLMRRELGRPLSVARYVALQCVLEAHAAGAPITAAALA